MLACSGLSRAAAQVITSTSFVQSSQTQTSGPTGLLCVFSPLESWPNFPRTLRGRLVPRSLLLTTFQLPSSETPSLVFSDVCARQPGNSRTPDHGRTSVGSNGLRAPTDELPPNSHTKRSSSRIDRALGLGGCLQWRIILLQRRASEATQRRREIHPGGCCPSCQVHLSHRNRFRR